jgi:TRAP-type mannitol/chloroaromatic compound transport system permease small subunit
MNGLLKLCHWIDAFNEWVGKWVYWLVLVVVLISAGNAIIRKTFNMSSNAWLELQWYLFSAIFLLCGAVTLLKNGHVRIDILAGRFSPKGQAWIDIFGTVFFLMPMALMFLWMSWPVFTRTFLQHEISGSAGGLVIWPARLLVPIGFAMLSAQGLSELVKRVAFVTDRGPDPVDRGKSISAEEELAEEIRRLAAEKA